METRGRPRSRKYDSEEFDRMWHSPTPVKEIAAHYDVALSTITTAAQRRGFITKFAARYGDRADKIPERT